MKFEEPKSSERLFLKVFIVVLLFASFMKLRLIFLEKTSINTQRINAFPFTPSSLILEIRGMNAKSPEIIVEPYSLYFRKENRLPIRPFIRFAALVLAMDSTLCLNRSTSSMVISEPSFSFLAASYSFCVSRTRKRLLVGE